MYLHMWWHSSCALAHMHEQKIILSFLCVCVCVSVRVQAQDVMMEKQGVATRLLYQLYVALQRKEVCVQGRREGEGCMCDELCVLTQCTHAHTHRSNI